MRTATLPPLASLGSFTSEVLNGDAARDARDWVAAVRHYRAAVEREPDDAGVWLRLGEAAGEAGDLAAAEHALRRALTLDADSLATRRALADLLSRLDRSDEAAAVLAEAAALESTVAPRQEAATGYDPRPTERWRELTAAAVALAEAGRAARALIGGSAYPLDAYDRFRRDFPVRPPPGPPPTCDLLVVIDAAQAAPFLIRATVRSLQDQSLDTWRAIVVAPEAVQRHPVASFATVDPRMAFATAPALDEAAHVVLIDGGTVLDPEALAWLAFAVTRTDCAAAFADHDHGIADPQLGLIRADPVFHGAFDPAWLAEHEAPALVVAARPAVETAIAAGLAGEPLRRAVLHDAASAGGVPHVARLLATRTGLPLIARHGRVTADDSMPGRMGPLPPAPPERADPRPRDTPIAVIIPTRDAADMLARAIETLRATARNAARLDIVVVDNRSVEEQTTVLLERLAADGIARSIAFDAPFNYSLGCNLGAAATGAPVVLFANNDIEMLSVGWDDVLLEALDDPQVGAVGARLLYPNGTIQHAGIAFGFGPGGAEHEGRAVSAGDPGPDRRYVTTHAAAAVTGAFQAVRRADFDAVGGFDAERLGIAYSDLDLCLKLRERGLTILYCPAIEAIHYESVTRGINESRIAIGWDEGERADLIARWGGALGDDPGVSPYWVRGGDPFAGLTEPSPGEIVRHLDMTARHEPWRVARRDATDPWPSVIDAP